MSNDVIQAKYDQLDAVARKFKQQAQATTALHARITRSAHALQQGGWQGRGAAAFFAEMNGVVYPTMQRLSQALDEAHTVTLQISAIMQQAEQEAAGRFRSGASVELLSAAGGADASPLSPWMTAPFAAGASVLGPVPVPVLGPWGRVPAGYSNAGSRLWLYIGGSGPDTIFRCILSPAGVALLEIFPNPTCALTMVLSIRKPARHSCPVAGA